MRGGAGSQPTHHLGRPARDPDRAAVGRARSRRSSRTATPGRSPRDNNWNTQVTGTTPDYFTIRNWHVERGRAVHGIGPGRRREDRGDRPDRRRAAVRPRRRSRSARSIRIRNAPVHGRRRARAQGPERRWAGPGRRDLHPARRPSRRASSAASASSCPADLRAARCRPRRSRARARGDRAAAARAPSPRARTTRTTSRPQHGRDDRHADARRTETMTHAARLDRAGLAARRRHRRHEHHAGVGHRADARDRHPHGRRRAAGATSSRSS